MKLLLAGEPEVYARYLVAVMKKSGIDFTHIPPDRLQEMPSTQDQLSEYDAVIISDAPGSDLSDRMALLKEYVKKGGGLGMIGGWWAFTGSKGNYRGTPVEEVLPVDCLPEDDRINDSNGFKIIKKTEHPILKGLPWNDAPTICGYNKVVAKSDAEILLTSKRIESIGKERVEGIKLAEEEDPLLAVRKYGGGKTLALMTDASPHWVGGMVDWGKERVMIGDMELGDKYIQFLGQILKWLAKG